MKRHRWWIVLATVILLAGKGEGVVKKTEQATFGAGCFWCAEAVFESLAGVLSVTSGYSGGTTLKPTYKQVCSGQTGHAEVVRVVFDPVRISYEKLLETFWATHDPTTPNRQGGDVGTQYRSVIFCDGEEQKQAAERMKKKLDASGKFDSRIVTEIKPSGVFYPAEPHHQDYFRKNPNAPYCRMVIKPKLRKLEKGAPAAR